MSDGANPYAAFGGTTTTTAPPATPAPASAAAAPAGGDPYAAFGGSSFTPAAKTEPSGIAGVLSGIGGGVIGTAAGAERLLNRALPSSMQLPTIPEEYYKQRTPAEKLGGGIESVGEFIAGDEALKGLDLASRLGLATKVAQIAQQSPRIARALEYGMNALRAAGVGGAQGGLEASAEGKPVLEGAERGALSAGVGSAAGEAVVGPAIQKVGQKLEEAGPKIGNALLQANKVKNFLYGKNPGRVFVDEDIPLKFHDYESIQSALKDANTRIAGEARQLLSQTPGANRAIDVVPQVDTIFDQAKQVVQSKSAWNDRKGLLKDLQSLREEITQNFDLNTGDAIGPKGPLTPAEITKLKTDVGRRTKWDVKKGEDENIFLNNVRKQVYSYLDKTVDAAVPEMKPINERWANLIEAEGLIGKRVAQDQAAGFGQSKYRSKAIIAAGLGLMHAGMSPEGALMILNEAARTPTGRVLRTKAEPIVGKALQKIPAGAARVAGAAAGKETAEPEEEE